MASGLYLKYKALKIFACGGRVPGCSFAGNAIDRVNQFISEIVDIFSCSRPVLTFRTTVLKHMTDEFINMSFSVNKN